MFLRRDRCAVSSLRRVGAGLAAAMGAVLLLAGPAFAQFLPQGFFDQVPQAGARAQVEANTLAYDGDLDVISAEGRVIMLYEGYTIHCDRMIYKQGNGDLFCEGHAVIRDPIGTLYNADRIEVTGGMKKAFVETLTLTTTAGAIITADDVRYEDELTTILNTASYSPCGLCIDTKGNRIGWKVRAARIIQDQKTDIVYLEQPSLEILGIPVAWLPWFALPDPSKPRGPGFRLPSVDYAEELGARVNAPYFIPIGKDIDILLTPSLLSRQGFLMAAEWEQRFEYGHYKFKASGIYQLDPSAFAGEVGERDWRGSAQSSGQFTPLADWTIGWSYTAFTDAGYLHDYDLVDTDNLINEVYATDLTDDHFADLRLQQFNLLGNIEDSAQKQQAAAIPNIRADSYTNLDAFGQVHVEARVLGVRRGADTALETYDVVPYTFGYEEEKLHATLEGSWQRQYVLPGGVVATPYLGLRADATSFSNPDLDGGEPGDAFLLSATPIAAMDVRFPLIASSGLGTHLLEPIAQVVYRGSDTTLVGITNDNAQSFVLDDTNLFSYNRFSGSDRQETGLRATIGARYLANFDDGRWLELIGGQSYHLAGVNGLGVIDHSQTGNSTGLGDDASDVVLGAKGSPLPGVTTGAKLRIDASDFAVARAGLAAEYRIDAYFVGTDYIYLPANLATGVLSDQHEITFRAGAPLPFDYWSANGSFSWDLAASNWLEARAELTYDDGYFSTGGFARITGPTHSNPDDFSFGFTFLLKGPDGEFGM